jgi:transposase-like protein
MQRLKEISRAEFENEFGEKEACLFYLSELKWGDGYQCRNCKENRYTKGKQAYSRRCKKCGYDESATSHTMFHKLKFGIDKAFSILYELANSKKGANSVWLSERYDINQKTAWLFRSKAQTVMSSSKEYPLENDVHIDEFEIGTPQKGEQGRGKSEKKIRVVIAIEYRNGKSGRGYAQVIDDFSAKSLRSIFEDHISPQANILADGWSGYKPLKEDYPNLKQVLSEKGRNFPMIHNQIRNFKNWLRGVHSYCNHEYLTRYIEEYFFRFNRRNHRKSILYKLIERMANASPITFTQIQVVAT